MKFQNWHRWKATWKICKKMLSAVQALSVAGRLILGCRCQVFFFFFSYLLSEPYRWQLDWLFAAGIKLTASNKFSFFFRFWTLQMKITMSVTCRIIWNILHVLTTINSKMIKLLSLSHIQVKQIHFWKFHFSNIYKLVINLQKTNLNPGDDFRSEWCI